VVVRRTTANDDQHCAQRPAGRWFATYLHVARGLCDEPADDDGLHHRADARDHVVDADRDSAIIADGKHRLRGPHVDHVDHAEALDARQNGGKTMDMD